MKTDIEIAISGALSTAGADQLAVMVGCAIIIVAIGCGAAMILKARRR